MANNMTREQIEEEIKFLFNKAQITHSARLRYLADLGEGTYKRPEFQM